MSEPRQLDVNVAFGLPILIENLGRLAKHQKRKDGILAYRLLLATRLLEGLDDDELWTQIRFRLKAPRKTKGDCGC